MSGSFPFPHNPPPVSGFLAPKPMQWPAGVQPEEDDWEFFPEAIKSWRAWRVVYHPLSDESDKMDNSVIMLQSITYKSIWTPRQEMIAECKPMRMMSEVQVKDHSHPCPDPAHGCGIYSVKTEEQALDWKKFRPCVPVVWGQTSIWGHVYKFTKGYLSEFAYPSQIYVPEDLGDWNNMITSEVLALELSSTYGVEAVTI